MSATQEEALDLDPNLAKHAAGPAGALTALLLTQGIVAVGLAPKAWCAAEA